MPNRGYMRAVPALLLALVIAAACVLPAVAVSASDFADVSSGAWYYDAVSYVVSKGLFNGMNSTTFAPKGTMTRGMFLTVLGRYAGVDPDAWRAGTVTGSAVNLRSGPGTNYEALTYLERGASVTILGVSGVWYQVRYGSRTGYIHGDYLSPKYHRFSDVDYSSYYAGYVIWGYEKGIVSGVSDAAFAPNDNVTREQICKLLAGYAASAGIELTEADDVSFADQSSISGWAQDGVEVMRKAGVVTGSESGGAYYFKPKNSATRAEAAAIFRRFERAAVAPATATDAATPAPLPAGETDDLSRPASFLSETVAVRDSTIRVGLLVNTKSYQDAVERVTLEVTNGTGFEYGEFASDRSFRSAGSLSSASVSVTSDGGSLYLKDSGGKTVYSTGGSLALRPVSGGKALTRVNGETRYFGAFELRQAYNAAGRISLINYVDIEDYVKGVLPYEYGSDWPTEALKAGAVAVRNFVMTADFGTYSAYGFDVIGKAGFQLYLGRGTSYGDSHFAATDAAADETKGVYLTYASGGENRLCTTYYCSSDGGATEDAAHVWGGSVSYLVGKPDPYEKDIADYVGNYSASSTLSRTGSALRRMAASAGLGDTAIARDGIRIETYPATGNVKSITLTGENGRTVTVDGSTSYGRWSFLSDFGISGVSYRYTVTYDAAADTFTCTRRGNGHNVGLSQWGAYSMAQYHGKSYQDILGFYYDGTHLQYGA